MGKFRAITVMFLLLFTLMTYSAAAETTLENDVTIDADQMEYDVNGKAVTATGNVILKSTNLEVRSDEMVYYDTGWVEVQGKAHIKNEQGEFDGDGLRYHVPTKTGEMKHLQGKESEYYFKGKTGTVSPEEDVINKGTVTRCERPKPCYRLHAGRVRLRNGRLIIERGYLDIKGVPVFPIFYLNLDMDKIENWPDIKVGRDEERGIFISNQRNYQISPTLSGYGKATLGTNEYFQLGGGLTWSPGAGYTLAASGSTEWSVNDDQALSFYVSKTIWSKGNQSISASLFQDLNQADRSKSDPRYRNDPTYDGTLYGARFYYSPKKDLTFGLGWANAEGEYYGDAGWGVDSTLHWKDYIGKNWKFTVDGGYHWGNAGGRWNEQKLSITRYFHCISATISRDFLDEEQSWQFTWGIRF